MSSGIAPGSLSNRLTEPFFLDRCSSGVIVGTAGRGLPLRVTLPQALSNRYPSTRESALAIIRLLRALTRGTKKGRRSVRGWNGKARPPLFVEVLEDCSYPTPALTQAGQALGLSLSTFATGFPTQGNGGPRGIEFPRAGGRASFGRRSADRSGRKTVARGFSQG